MKPKMKFVIIPVIVMGLILALTTSCQKDEEPSDKITDKDGNVYTSVSIGTQVWMVGNLKTTKFNDGTAIQLVTDDSEWKNLTSSAFCYYDNDALMYKDDYGPLYNWFAVNSGKLCPSGWHVPSYDEWWTQLINTLGVGSIGDKLKETGTTHWKSPNIGANNETGFTALPGGFRTGFDGEFILIGSSGYWWTTTDLAGNKTLAWHCEIMRGYSDLFSDYQNKKDGYSVRCVKD